MRLCSWAGADGGVTGAQKKAHEKKAADGSLSGVVSPLESHDPRGRTSYPFVASVPIVSSEPLDPGR
jgi:hypothetical protein